MRYTFDSIYAYDTNTKTWHYDCKYHLDNGWWLYDETNKKAMKVDKYHTKRMNEIMKDNPDIFHNTEITSAEHTRLLSSIASDLEYCPEPSYGFEPGDKVIVGNLTDPVIDSVHENGKAYIIDFTNHDKDTTIPHQKRAFCWYMIRPLCDNTSTFIENNDVKINFSNATIESLIFKVLHFGVDFDPKYQRDLVWTDEDREALLDSVFHNIDIGKFAFIHLGYDGHYGYQILDGKQRLTALLDFYLNKYPYKGKYYNDLSKRDKIWFRNRVVACGEMQEANQEQILKYFLMLNTTGKTVDKQHLDKVAAMLEQERNGNHD